MGGNSLRSAIAMGGNALCSALAMGGASARTSGPYFFLAASTASRAIKPRRCFCPLFLYYRFQTLYLYMIYYECKEMVY